MFTRKGDSGETESKGGERITKSSIAVEVEGMIDETSSTLGFSIVKSKWEDITSDLQRCQELIFNMGEHILIDGTGRVVRKEDVEWVEERTLRYREEIGRIDLFVLPGGSEESVALHMSRVVARRLERSVVKLNSSSRLDPVILQFANRLSSLLFMMALVANKRLGFRERIWELRKTSVSK